MSWQRVPIGVIIKLLFMLIIANIAYHVIFSFICTFDKDQLLVRNKTHLKEITSSENRSFTIKTSEEHGQQPIETLIEENSSKPNEPNHQRRIKRILLWNSFFNDHAYIMGVGHSGFTRFNCPVKSCTITTDKNENTTADAIVFHAFRMNQSGIVIPPRGHSRQIYVFLLLESPLVANQRGWLDNLEDTFNLTFTYLNHPLTDIVVPYGEVVRKPVRGPPMMIPRRKPGFVARVASNCYPQGEREAYVEELSKYINIDTFGLCGTLSCPKPDRVCHEKIASRYMFQLSFENSYCDDYLTEKAFHPLRRNIVPVVLGGANYSQHLPPKSFVDVRDFSSPRHLAQHLLRLRKHPVEYAEYLRWKRDYMPRPMAEPRGHGFCRLCEILHDTSYKYKSGFDPNSYWTPEMCLSGVEERRALHLVK